MPKKMKITTTDFINYGTYRNSDADILKIELEKAGIPVKALYPGSNIGREAVGGASCTAYKLLIRACDMQKAERIRKRLNIASIGIGEAICRLIWNIRFLQRY